MATEALAVVRAKALSHSEGVARRALERGQAEEWTRISHPWYIGRPTPPTSLRVEEGWERLVRLETEGKAVVRGPPPEGLPFRITRGAPPLRPSLRARKAVRKMMQEPKPKAKPKVEVKLPSRRVLEARRAAAFWAAEDLSWME